jgi:hypothetical protein
MKKTTILLQLEELCRKLAIVVKYDRFFGHGGYCRLRDKSYFIINESLSNEAKEKIFFDELESIDFQNVSVPDSLRELLHKKWPG